MTIVTLSDIEVLKQDKTHASVLLEHVRLELEKTYRVPADYIILLEERAIDYYKACLAYQEHLAKSEHKKPFWKKLFRK